MLRNVALAAIYGVVVLTAALARSADYGTAEEARATLDKAVAAVKVDKTKALDMFNKGDGGFKDRDLYVFCANASDGILTAHPTHEGEAIGGHQGQEGLSARARDDEERHRGNDKRGDVLVASSWLRQAARKDFVLHKGRRSNVRRRLLQVNPFTAGWPPTR